MSYNKSLDFWFKCLNYVGMDPTKPKKYFGFLFIELSASFVALLALLDFFIQPDETDAFATLSVFVQVYHAIFAKLLC